MTSIQLPNGAKMPIVGLGTWQSPDTEELEKALDEALSAGYRHIDTAYNYLNEKSIGKVLKKWLDSGKVKREELFIVTKLPMIAMTPDRVKEFLGKSLKDLQLSYVDLYLVHSPVGFLRQASDLDIFPRGADGKCIIDPATDLEGIWGGMEREVDAGRARAIGISNFDSVQIERMVKCARIKPANLQIELHVYFQQKILREVCKKHGISVTAYAPFGSPGRKELKFNDPGILNDPVVKRISEKHGKTPGQVLIRFTTQLGVIVIPKSTSPQRIRQNLEVFDFTLTSEEMKELEGLDKGTKGRTFSWGSFPGVEMHPENPKDDTY